MPKISFFSPSSIAIVGASRDPQKIGHVILDNIIKSGYKGKLIPVNPNAKEIMGLKTYENVMDISEKTEMAIIAIPGQFVADVVEDCGMKGIKNVVIISAGFGEVGDAGFAKEAQLIDIAAKYKMQLLGPNCLGFINTSARLNATFAASYIAKGNIAFASQSGAMGTAFLDWANGHNIGLKYFISLGNKAVLDENAVLEEMETDDSITSILFYLEDFSDGRRFFELARKISHKKAIIILKPGRSENTRSAIASHTGSIAQDETIIDAALRDAGCLRVQSIEELFNLTTLLSWQPLPKNNTVAVVTNAGGVGIQTVDDLERNGLKVVPFSHHLSAELAKFLPAEANVKNPVDLLGDALADRYKLALEQVVKDKSVGSILVVLTPQMVTQALETAKYVNQIADKNKKTVMASFVGGESIHEARQLLIKEQIPHFDFPNDAAKALGLVWKWQSQVKDQPKVPKTIYFPSKVNTELNEHATDSVVDLAYAQQLFASYKIPLLESKLVQNKAELHKAAHALKYPVVLKLVHPKLIHKTEFKAVRLNIANDVELTRQAGELEVVAKSAGLKDFGFELQPFIEDRLEVIVGIKKDKATFHDVAGKGYLRSKGFGHILLFGAGGIYTELYKDAALKLLPVDAAEAKELIELTKVGKIIEGLRGKSYDLKGITEVIVNLSKLIEDNTNIAEVDINPLFVTKDAVYVADLKVFAQ